MTWSRKQRITAVISASVVAVLALFITFPILSRSTTSTNCNGVAPSECLPCPYIDQWTFLKSGIAQFDVVNQGQDTIIMSSATISGGSNNTGFTISVTFNLNDTKITPNGSVEFSSPVLQNIQDGDHITITVRTTVGSYYTRQVTG